MLKEIHVPVLTHSWQEQEVHVLIEMEIGRTAGARRGCKEHFIMNAVLMALFPA